MTTDSKWNIDIKPALAALKKLRDNIGKTDKKAAEGFDRSAAAAKQARDEMGRFVKSGQKGAISLKAALGPAGLAAVVLGLVAAFTQLSKVAVTALADVTKEAVNLNAEAELTRLSLISIFEGNEAAADAFIGSIGELAIKLGTSRQELTGLAKGILPDVGSIAGTAELLENVIVLGRDAGQRIESIRIATEEALSGNLSSLGRRLNIPRKTIDSIKEYQKEMSLADAINRGLAERIAETGISADVTADSFITLQGKVAGSIEGFKILLGIAPFEELKIQSKALIETLEAQREEIGFVAGAFGSLSTNVIEFVGSGLNDFLADLDFKSIEILVDEFNELLSLSELVLDILFDIPSADDGIKSTTVAIIQMQEALMQVAKFAKFARDALKTSFLLAKATFQIQQGDFGGALETGGRILDLASAEAQAESAKNVEAAFASFEERQKSLKEAQIARREATKKGTAADIAAGEAVIANKKRLEELETAQSEAAKAQDEINKKTAGAEADRQRKLTAIIRGEADKRFDDAVKAAQAREDIARKNVDDIEAIFRKNSQDIAEGTKDLSREEQAIARKGARDRRDLELDAANERVDIERNFRQELKRIQDQFNQDAADAERNNDAQAFLRAVRSRDQQVDVATQDRDISVEEAGINAERQREALAVQLAAEVEDARIANTQKLEDLQTRLNQELEAQAIKVQQEFEAETIREQRLKEQRDLALQRQLENFARTEAEKQVRLQESLAAQVALIEAAAAKEIEITAAAEAQKTAIVQAEAAKRATILAKKAEQRETARRKFGSRAALGGEREFGAGGRPPVGDPVIVGDRGPEIFLPDQAGTIIPNNAIFSPPAQASPAGASSMTSITNSPTFNLAESMFQDPVARRQLTNFVLGVLAEGG